MIPKQIQRAESAIATEPEIPVFLFRLFLLFVKFEFQQTPNTIPPNMKFKNDIALFDFNQGLS